MANFENFWSKIQKLSKLSFLILHHQKLLSFYTLKVHNNDIFKVFRGPGWGPGGACPGAPPGAGPENLAGARPRRGRGQKNVAGAGPRRGRGQPGPRPGLNDI